MISDEKYLMSFQQDEVFGKQLTTFNLKYVLLIKYYSILYRYSGIHLILHNSSSKYLKQYSVSSFEIKKQNRFQFKIWMNIQFTVVH